MNEKLLIELVSGCNLQCKMCAFKGGFTGKEMPRELINSVFKSAKKINKASSFYNFTSLRMDGNSEPLLYKD